MGWQEKPKIVPTRLMASKRTSKRYGTAVCALSNKATRQKEGIKKPITHRASNWTLQGWKLIGEPSMTKQNFQFEVLLDRRCHSMQPPHITTKVEFKSCDMQCGGNVAIKNARGQWLWLQHYQRVVLLQWGGEKLSRPRPGFIHFKTTPFIRLESFKQHLSYNSTV